MIQTQTDSTKKITDFDLFMDLHRVNSIVDRTVRSVDYDERGKYGLRIYYERFGEWATALEKAGISPPTKHPTGEDSPCYNGGYLADYGSNWGRKRREALERDGYQCQICGLSRKDHKEEFGKDIHVHHIKPRSDFDDVDEANELKNLKTVCVRCHRYVEPPNG